MMLQIIMLALLNLVTPELPVEEAYANTMKYYEAVSRIESDQNRYAVSSHSSASSYFQVTIGSFQTAKKRAERMGVKVKEDYIGELDYNNQAALLFIDLYQRKGTDPLIKLIAHGNVWAAKRTYYKYHHTAPDKATIKRAERIFKEVYNGRADSGNRG